MRKGVKATPLAKIWLNELDVLDTKYDVYKKHREDIQKGGKDTSVKKSKTSKK
jgi:hypothetical protein